MEKINDNSPIGNGKKTYQYVFEYFSNQMLTGELKMNDKIPPERDVAEQLGVSRNSIREVMHMLEMNGLIECVQGSGNYVRCDPIQFMKKSVNLVMSLMKIHYTEVFYVREGYEFTALKLAMRNATVADLKSLEETLLNMDAAQSHKESAKYDMEFHKRLMIASHNRLVVLYESMIEELMSDLIGDFRERIMSDPVDSIALRKSHWDIYYAVKDKNFNGGVEAMTNHFALLEKILGNYS